MNVAESVDRAARHLPQGAAILFEGEATSYATLRAQVARVAAGLQAQGVGPGDRIALFLPNIPAFAVAYFACQWIGAITVSVNSMLTRDEVAYVLRDSGARLAFTTETLWPQLEPLADSLLGGVDRTVICEGTVPGTLDLASLGQNLPEVPLAMLDPHAPAAILYTSGTTGRQKGAILSVGNICSNAHAARHYLRLDPPDRLLLFLPLFHVFGQNFIMNAAFAAGATLILHRRFDPERVLESIERDRATMFFGVPTIFINLLNTGVPPERLRSLRYYFSAAATMPVEVAQRWREVYGLPIYEGYGLTETSPMASYNHEWEYRPGSVGTGIAGVELRIVDPQDRELARGEWGEICIRGPNVMLGYWNRPDESAEALRGGWFHSGDVGYMDADGYVYIVDRTKDMINSAGFKIWPREVEEVLYEHPDIRECAVIGAPDPVKGEVTVAVIVPQAGRAPEPAELEAYCRQRLASYKVPRFFSLVETLPKSATGKILKRVLREQAARTEE